MSKAPGYQKSPHHKIIESRFDKRVTVTVNGVTIADSIDVIKVEEDRHPTRFYFPRSDVTGGKLEASNTASTCPFKGTAQYFNLIVGGRTYSDAIWTYPDPYDEHRQLAGLLAFYDDKIPEMHIAVAT